jgi:hypothetical protein
MRNIFLLYMPPGNAEAMMHYEDTIKQRVPLTRIRPFLSADEAARLGDVFGGRRIAAWGSRDSTRNRATFSRMELGDDLLIVEGKTIRFIGKIAMKRIDPGLSRELWKPLQKAEIEGWDLIYFIANPLEISVPFAEFARLVGFQESFQLQGFTGLSRERLEASYGKYDDLYSVMLTLQHGRAFAVQRDAIDAGAAAALDAYAATNRSEFFAVATESFFCVPDRLRDRLPDLYLQLSRFYRQDPGQARPR